MKYAISFFTNVFLRPLKPTLLKCNEFILSLPGKPCPLSQVPYRWFLRWTLTAWTQSVGATPPPPRNQTQLPSTVKRTPQPSARIVLLLTVRRSINSVRWCAAVGGDRPYIHLSRELITMRCP